MPDYAPAPTGSKIFGKLPVNHDQAAQMIDTFIVPLLERAGLTVKVAKTKNGRAISVVLPKK